MRQKAMDSLEKISLHFVAKYASFYGESDLEELPQPVIVQLALYLSAYQLNRLHSVFIKTGISVQKIWKKHLAFHWNKSSDCSAKIFNSDHGREKLVEPRSLFLERLFKKILGNLDLDLGEHLRLNLMARCLHGRMFHCCDSTSLEKLVLYEELLQYASHVRVLTVAATSPMVDYLLNHRYLLQILQGCVCQLQVYCLSNQNFIAVKELMQLLVLEGGVTEFAIFKSKMSSCYLKDLLLIASGQKQVPGCSEVNDECLCTNTQVCNHLFADEDSDDDEFIVHDYVDSDVDNHDVDVGSQSVLETPVTHETSPVHDDLYDVALTSASVTDQTSHSNCRCSLSSSIGEHVKCVNNPLRCELGLNHKNIDLHLPLENSQMGQRACEHLPKETVIQDFKPVSALNQTSAATFNDSLPHHGCTSFALAYFSGDQHLRKVLLEVLNEWKILKKLAFLEVSVEPSSEELACAHSMEFGQALDMDFSAIRRYEPDIEQFLHTSIMNKNFTHVVFYGTGLVSDTFINILLALCENETSTPSLEEVSLLLYEELEETLPQYDLDLAGFYGARCVDFHTSGVLTATSALILSWIRNDHAMKSLHLPFFYQPSFLNEALLTLSSNPRIEELHATGNIFDAVSCSSLVSMMRSVVSLRKLNLSECGLSKTNLNSDSFIQAICEHPAIQDLNLSMNYLEDIGSRLLKAICLRRSSVRYDSLDFSYNRISGKLLLKAMEEIQMVRSQFPVCELKLSGNLFEGLRDQLVCSFMDCVDVLVADDPSLANPAGSLADHVSQM